MNKEQSLKKGKCPFCGDDLYIADCDKNKTVFECWNESHTWALKTDDIDFNVVKDHMSENVYL